MDSSSPRPETLQVADMAFAWPGRGHFRMSVPSLTVARGERVVLLGSSGSGKSTLLSLICGILSPDTGSIAIDGTDLAALSGRARDRLRADKIGVIFQQFNLLPFASPLDNILLPLRFSTTRRARVPDPEAEALRLTAALDLPDRSIRTARAADLSVGQQQRVAVARALIGAPALIVADEPTSALDAATQSVFLDLLFGQVAEAGSSLIMVTHDDRLTGRFDRTLHLAEIAQVSREAAA